VKLQLDLLARDRREVLTEKQRTVVERMSLSTRRLAELIDSVLEYARVQSGRIQTHPERFDLAGIAREVADAARGQADEKGLALHLDGAEGALEVESDPRLVRLVLVNLVDNALKYTE